MGINKDSVLKEESQKTKNNAVLVIGAGAFGTSIGHVLSSNFSKVYLKVRSEDVYDALKKGENDVYLPGRKLSKKMIPALSWEELDEVSKDNKIELVVLGLPSSALKTYCKKNASRLLSYFKRGVPLVSLAKGIDEETLELPDDILMHYFYEYKDLCYFLSGPSFAQEILDNQITLVSLAGANRQRLQDLSDMLQTDYFKVFPTYDVKGVLLGGALKNVLAIAAGVIEGLGHNYNTKAALITRGISEMLRLGSVFNARPETFYGLSGMGDLILTTTGLLSRNRKFGLELAKGKTPKEVIDSWRMVVEGYKTARAVYRLGNQYSIRMTIFNAVYEVLHEGKPPRSAIDEVMRRSSRFIIE